MGFFSSTKEVKPRKMQERPEQTQARNYLAGLYQQDINLPTQQVAGMSDIEKSGQKLLSNWVQSSSYQDPYESAVYQNVRTENRLARDDAAARLKKDAQAAGSSGSAAATQKALGDLNSRYDQNAASTLANLTVNERNRADAITQEKINASASIGALQRQLENQQNVADYQAAMQNILAPYQYQSQLASLVLSDDYDWFTPSYVQKDGALDQIAQVGQVAGGIAGLFALSDKRLKIIMHEVPGPFIVRGCKWYVWRWNDTAESLGKVGHDCGLIAQDVQAYYPGCVVKGDDGYLRIDYKKLIREVVK